jgi:hypothetical protein
MPAKAPRGAPRGIHDFSVSVTKALDSGTATKSWMPACAGMTRCFGVHRHIFASLAAQLRAPLIFRVLNSSEYKPMKLIAKEKRAHD